MVILEAALTLQEKVWYIQAVRQSGWSKLELQKRITASAHMEISLNNTEVVCYTEENATVEETSNCAVVQDSQRHRTGNPGSIDGVRSTAFRVAGTLRSVSFWGGFW